MPVAKIERIANNRMDAEHADLGTLMDDDGWRCRQRSLVWSSTMVSLGRGRPPELVRIGSA
jgi:hypothetical protein